MSTVSTDLSARCVRAVLFDLDGTIGDTAVDIACALNRALAGQGLPRLPAAQVRVLIGRGVPTLVERAVALLGASAESADVGLLLEEFHSHYERMQQLDEIQARVYPGVARGLAELRTLGLRLAVVTNKPQKASVDLLARWHLSRWIDVVIGGDDGEHRKPHPQPLLNACKELEVLPDEALMVGDSSIDVLAARNAGLAVVCVSYGYNEGADPRGLPCDALIGSIDELPALLRDTGRLTAGQTAIATNSR
jgi:phosphoglycolate phosphatase